MLDRDVDVEPLLGEDREDMAAGQHKVGRLVTARDRHPVCVDDGDFSDMAEGPIGRSLKRVEDPRLLRGEGRFVDDLAAPLHVAFVRSPVASGRLRSIDAAASRVTVFTAADIEGSCLPLAVHLTTPGAVSPARPILAIDRVRFVGEMIAAVVAENRYAAADAVELIQPEIDPLPAVVGFEEAIAECLGLDRSRVRVVAADVGGGFGGKAQVYPEEILLAWIARRMNTSVKWVETRSEHMQAAGHARDQRVEFSAAVRKDGRVLGLRAKVLSSIGAYGIRPFGPLLDPLGTAGLIPGPYDIRDYEYETYAVATNKTPEGPYRGVGMVTAVLVHERLMDLIAARLSLDPPDVRRVNFVTAAQMPYTSVTHHPYESGDYTAALDAALAAFDYASARDAQESARAAGRTLGVGLASYVEYTGAGSSTFKGRGMTDIPGVDTARAWLAEDGRIHLQTSSPVMGQGSHTTFAPVAAAGLGVEPARTVAEQTDRSRVGGGTGSFMSRGSVTAATSTYRAARLLRDAILETASDRFNQPIDRIAIDGVTLSRLAADNGELDISVTYDAVQAAHPYATHACLVEVDKMTGEGTVLRYVVAEDCGVLINPMIVEGQVAGGVAQALGAALFEEVAYGPDGELRSGTFLDYLIPSIGEVLTVQITHLVTPSTVHGLGTKGAGEGGTT